MEDLLRNKLQQIVNESTNCIRKQVAIEALDYCSIASFFEDLAHHGCSSGMVGSLVYYYDTHKFFDEHYDEIEEIRYEYEDSIGQAITPQGDLKNWYAWFGFEYVAYNLANELGLEV